jgi:hypothetical protein
MRNERALCRCARRPQAPGLLLCEECQAAAVAAMPHIPKAEQLADREGEEWDRLCARSPHFLPGA